MENIERDIITVHFPLLKTEEKRHVRTDAAATNIIVFPIFVRLETTTQ